jgi:hypothetical protein
MLAVNGVEMWDSVLTVEHAYYDAEEARNLRHRLSTIYLGARPAALTAKLRMYAPHPKIAAGMPSHYNATCGSLCAWHLPMFMVRQGKTGLP